MIFQIVAERGRTPDDDTRRARQEVAKFFAEHKQGTTAEIASQYGVPIDDVRRALRYFEKQGNILKSNTRKRTKGSPGQPPLVWKKVN